MKKLLVAAMLVAFATVAYASDTVVMEAKNGNVTFNHKNHSASMECKVCHGEGTPSKIDIDKKAAHALCKDCHKTKKQGPTKCKECHVK
ncbi:MAG: cytochrome C [Desulfuromonas sp.]|nr:MAG: cytochrome C [Desulfuromonas sp.]